MNYNSVLLISSREADIQNTDTTHFLPQAKLEKMSDEKSFSKALEKFTEKGEYRKLTIYHNRKEPVIAGDQEIV